MIDAYILGTYASTQKIGRSKRKSKEYKMWEKHISEEARNSMAWPAYHLLSCEY